MQINREKVEKQFTAYASGYGLTDVKVRLKLEHTFRVAALCDCIADSLFMSREDKDLAWLLGMLHDIGRFEQLRRFHTFRDGLSVNHAELGADLLFKEKLILRFVGEQAEKEGNVKEAALIEKAVRFHNSYGLPETMGGREYRFAALLRDADKVDILRVNIQTPRTEIYDLPEEIFLEAPVTDPVLEDILQWKNIDRRIMRTPADLLLGHISFVFGLVYKESVRQVRKQGYLEELLHFPSRNPDTAAKFAQVRERIHAYIDHRLKNDT